MPSLTPRPPEVPRNRWFQQPVVWLGGFIFLASLAGCVWMIVLGGQHADESLLTNTPQIMKMPLDRSAELPPDSDVP